MRILAMDPSLSCIGWALMETGEDELRHLEWVSSWGKAEPTGTTFDDKLASAGAIAERVLRGASADILAVEMPVVYRNPQTTIKLAQVVGVVRWAAHHWVDRVIEIQPGGRLAALGLPVRLKRPIAKELVINVVNNLYKRTFTMEDHDIADAVAVGHAALAELRKEQWGR